MNYDTQLEHLATICRAHKKDYGWIIARGMAEDFVDIFETNDVPINKEQFYRDCGVEVEERR